MIAFNADLKDTICHPDGRSVFASSAALQAVGRRATPISQLDALPLNPKQFVKYPGQPIKNFYFKEICHVHC